MAAQRVTADLVFVVDATYSNENIICTLRDKVVDFYVEMRHRRRANIKFGVVVYRDPITNVANMDPQDINEFLDLVDNPDEVEAYLDKVECHGGHDDSEDWAGALDMALHQISWRDGKKCLFWLTDADAHGDKFSLLPNAQFDDQADKLEELTREMAHMRIHFFAINVNKPFSLGIHEGCEKTLKKMKEIYENSGGPAFKWADSIVDKDKDSWNDQKDLGELGRRLEETFGQWIPDFLETRE